MPERKSKAQPRFQTSVPAGTPHVFAAFKRAAALLGIDLLPWQKRVLRGIAARQDDKVTPLFADSLITLPRQSGKTWLALVLLVAHATELLEDGGIMVLCAQTRLDARDRLVDLGNRCVAAGIACKVNIGAGNERIVFYRDSGDVELRIMSPNEKGGHGWSVDFCILDEVWAIEPVVLAGIVPARAARPLSQLVAISTAGTTASEVYLDWQGKGREAAQSDEVGRFGYWEWSAADGVDVFDPATWWTYMPSLGWTVQPHAVEAAMQVLQPHQFERAYGNRTVSSTQPVVPSEWWEQTEDSTQSPQGVPLVLGVELSTSPVSAAIGAAWDVDGDAHLEVVDYSAEPRLSWVTERLQYLVDTFQVRMVVIDKGSPAGAVFTEVRALCDRAGIPLFNIAPREMTAACSMVYEGLRTGTLSHHSLEVLDDSVAGAVRKSVGDGWLFDRRRSTNDLAPLNAVTQALYGLAQVRVRPAPNIH